ncbi:MAG: YHS domain-containing protein [Actinomycetia bacterium]|nr:YHS domain-containing protein [Actinomycetes bacterium]
MAESIGSRVEDPVCHMTVVVEATTPRSEHRGATYYFCCEACKRRFDQDPDRYVN